jgi:FkbM family methyltransferase
VGHDISFELELCSQFGFDVYLYDPSPTGIRTIAAQGNDNKHLRYAPIGLAAQNGIATFAMPLDLEEGSYRLGQDGPGLQFEVARIADLMKANGHKHIDLLKLDIEGFEYEVLNDVLKSGVSVRQLCVEFHHWLPGMRTWDTLKLLLRLRVHGFILMHKHRFDYTFVKPTSSAT